MFQLNSKNGKFDIVFSENKPPEKDVKKNNLSNAGLRTRKEYKSSVLGAERQSHNSRVTVPVNKKQNKKNSEIPQRNAISKIQLDEKNNNVRENHKSLATRNLPNPKPVNKSHPVIRGNRASYLRKNIQPNSAKEEVKIASGNGKSRIQEANHRKQNNSKSPKNSSVVKMKGVQNVKTISQENPVPKEKMTSPVIDNTSNIVTSSHKHHQIEGSNSDAGILSQKQLEDIFQDFFKSDSNNNPNKQGDAVSEILVKNHVVSKNFSSESKQNPVYTHKKNLQTDTEFHQKKKVPDTEEYYPWGRPGGGAPLRNGDGNIRNEVKRYNLAVKREYEKEPSLEKETLFSSKSPGNEIKSSPRQGQVQMNISIDLDDYEVRQKKHTEHREAIKAQVEEKRRQRKIEMEQQLEEERKAEERYQKQQEVLQKRYEQEVARQKEKEEERRARLEMLAQKANTIDDEAFDKARKEKSRDNDPVSKNTQNNYMHHEEPKESLMGTYTINQPTSNSPSEKSKKKKDREKKKDLLGTYTVQKNDTFGSKIDSPEIRGERYPEVNMNDIPSQLGLNKRETYKKLDLGSLRSSFESDITGSDKSRNRKPEDGMFSDGSVITEYLPSPTNSPTGRQKQILDQLQNLREGLMRKQLEYLHAC